VITLAIDNAISLAQVLFHHGIQLFCLWKLRKVVVRNLKTHLPLEEFYALLKFNLRKPPQIASGTSTNARYCFGLLEKVNGSFAAMIIALPDEYSEAVCNLFLFLSLSHSHDSCNSFASLKNNKNSRRVYYI